MNIDRERLLRVRMDSMKAATDKSLPADVRMHYKRAADAADVALMLHSAMPTPSTKS
jgi:hypothetical protein